MNKELYEEINGYIAAAMKLLHDVPPSHERDVVIDRLTDAGMWSRLVLEMYFEPKIVGAKVKSKDCQ